MIRQYRIDRFNGMEILVCEVFDKHLWSQQEHEAFFDWKLSEEEKRPGEVYLLCDFNKALEAALESGKKDFHGIAWQIPTYDAVPHIVLRGPVVNNNLASLQVEYLPSVGSGSILEEVNRFYNFIDSPHWRNYVSNQIERYGSLFESANN